MKRLNILLVAVMIFALLAGCAQPTQAPEAEPTKAEAEATEAPEAPAEEPADVPANRCRPENQESPS